MCKPLESFVIMLRTCLARENGGGFPSVMMHTETIFWHLCGIHGTCTSLSHLYRGQSRSPTLLRPNLHQRPQTCMVKSPALISSSSSPASASVAIARPTSARTVRLSSFPRRAVSEMTAVDADEVSEGGWPTKSTDSICGDGTFNNPSVFHGTK